MTTDEKLKLMSESSQDSNLLSTDQKMNLITRNLEEVLTEDELKKLIESDTPLRHYIGFEISGKLHLGYLFILLKVKDLQDAGAETTIWLADLHSAINDKLDGNLDTIKKVARGYFTDAMKSLFESIGGDPEKLIFKLCSETYAENPEFWITLLKVGKATTLARTKRSITIMGREASDDSLPTDKLFYPIMQAADIFLLKANIAHAGMDQRKVHVVAREAASALGEKKPIAIHHPILLSLSGPAEGSGEADELAMRNKMSKSKPGSGISIHDTPDQIRQSINGAFAPEGQIEGNPLLNWTRFLVFYNSGAVSSSAYSEGELVIKRDEKFGGDVTYSSYEDLEKDYADKKLHPMDLKGAMSDWLIKTLEPVRKSFEDPTKKQALEELESLTNK